MTIVSNIPKPEGGFYKVGDYIGTKSRKEKRDFIKALGWQAVYYMDNPQLLRQLQFDGDGNIKHDAQGFACRIGIHANDIHNGRDLAWEIVGFLPENTATATTPNPPLTFDEAIECETLWLVWPKRIKYGAFNVYKISRGEGISWWHASEALYIDNCLKWGGNVYAHDPAVHPPTPREDG